MKLSLPKNCVSISEKVVSSIANFLVQSAMMVGQQRKFTMAARGVRGSHSSCEIAAGW